MTVALAITPASGSVISANSVCRIDLTGATLNDITTYNTDHYPEETPFTYYINFVKSGTEYGRSYVFSPDSAGAHVFNNYIFPSSGTWTVRLKNAGTDANVGSALTVTVS